MLCRLAKSHIKFQAGLDKPVFTCSMVDALHLLSLFFLPEWHFRSRKYALKVPLRSAFTLRLEFSPPHVMPTKLIVVDFRVSFSMVRLQILSFSALT